MDSQLIIRSNPDDLRFNVLDPPPLPKAIGLLDMIFGAEMAWHEGHSLGQTLFSCHYIDSLFRNNNLTTADLTQIVLGPRSADAEPLPLILEVVRLYCLAVVKTCERVIFQARRCGFQEEEDLSMGLFRRPLFPSLPISDLTAAIETVCGNLASESM